MPLQRSFTSRVLLRPAPAHTLLASAVLALTLAGCGGGGSGGGSSEPAPAPPPPDPLATYKSQPVRWGDCSRYFTENGIGPNAQEVQEAMHFAPYVAKLGDRAQCADVKAPLDYQKPDGLQISLSLLRVRPVDSAGKKPHLFFNPGGPGEDGRLLSLSFSQLLSNGKGDSTLGRKYQEMAEAYNFVGFSPRGVGNSTNLHCTGKDFEARYATTRWDTQAENIRRLTDSGRLIASNCQKNPLSDHIHTDATARDMDLMRHLLGDEKLHYYGISYGTWLGFWYAGLFPDRVGPVVLDSNMNFSKSIHDASISYQDGTALTFREHVAPYAARHDDIFRMGASAQAIVGDLGAVGHRVTQALHLMGVSFRAEPRRIPAYLAAVKVAIETQKLVDQGRSIDEIEAAFKAGGPHFADEKLDEAFREQAADMVGALRALEDPGFYAKPFQFGFSPSDAVWNTVVCNDEPLANRDQAYWVDKGFELAAMLPLIQNTVARQPCLYWERKATATKPSMQALQGAPLLMVQSQYDVPTPLKGAMETFEQLPAARMVRISGEGAHGLMVYQTECVDLAVMDHLLGRAPAQRLTECQARPLPFDESASAPQQAKSRLGSQPASPFQDPELAEQLMDRLRGAIRRSGTPIS
ncbi:alpha/beta hydrolase [Pulveribacter sp.]|uniref:alpha/beta hydrolase n=1 Tax=Pulveribacter sp. TaxID=2678893 RepID=UPI0028AECD21|nr:alpha/beta hydrolase [Pulveribacter sp.]